eukprot:IDg1275t1
MSIQTHCRPFNHKGVSTTRQQYTNGIFLAMHSTPDAVSTVMCSLLFLCKALYAQQYSTEYPCKMDMTSKISDEPQEYEPSCALNILMIRYFDLVLGLSSAVRAYVGVALASFLLLNRRCALKEEL